MGWKAFLFDRDEQDNNQWKNTSDVTNWFTSIPDMQKHSFALFDINSFYPSITESLLSKAISFAKNYTTIRDKYIDIIMHCRKSLLFDKETVCTIRKITLTCST